MIQFPPSFKVRMQEILGDEWNAFENAHAEPSPISLRINPAKNIKSGRELKSVPWSSTGFYLEARPSFTLDPLFHAGAYYVQEASSMFLEQAIKQHVHPLKNIRVLDLCAAPGGKSTHILSLLDHDSLLITNEVIRSRVNILSENIQKWGYPNTVVTNNDPADFSALQGFFDVIIVDAPCSGEGLFRKDPNAMREWSENNVALCSNRQRRILDDIWPALKEDGILVYSTCTYNEFEDENILEAFSSNHKLKFLSVDTNDWDIETVKKNNVIGYRFYPHKVRGEGFFLSVLKKHEEQFRTVVKSGKSGFTSPNNRVKEELKPWLKDSDVVLIQRSSLVQMLPSLHHETIYFLTQRLHVIYAGTFVATVKQNKLVPEHSFALSIQMNQENFQQIEVSEEQAVQYLKKDNLIVQSELKGFALAMFQNVPLGWMNLLQGRINNLYPSEWRIRMK